MSDQPQPEAADWRSAHQQSAPWSPQERYGEVSSRLMQGEARAPSVMDQVGAAIVLLHEVQEHLKFQDERMMRLEGMLEEVIRRVGG